MNFWDWSGPIALLVAVAGLAYGIWGIANNDHVKPPHD